MDDIPPDKRLIDEFDKPPLRPQPARPGNTESRALPGAPGFGPVGPAPPGLGRSSAARRVGDQRHASKDDSRNNESGKPNEGEAQISLEEKFLEGLAEERKAKLAELEAEFAPLWERIPEGADREYKELKDRYEAEFSALENDIKEDHDQQKETFRLQVAEYTKNSEQAMERAKERASSRGERSRDSDGRGTR